MNQLTKILIEESLLNLASTIEENQHKLNSQGVTYIGKYTVVRNELIQNTLNDIITILYANTHKSDSPTTT